MMGKKWRDDQGMFITPKYNHLIFVAKISEILTMKEYLLSPKSNNRRDAYTYQWLIEKNGLNQSSFMNEIVILADRFNYFGSKSPLEIPKEIFRLFPMGERARMNGKPFPRWNAKNGFYNSEERFTDVLELMEFAETILGSQKQSNGFALSSILYTRKRIVKIILSRKGFDSSNGSIPSPILPDGTLLSLPIPAKFDSISFDDLNYNGVLFSDILRQLKGKKIKQIIIIVILIQI